MGDNFDDSRELELYVDHVISNMDMPENYEHLAGLSMPMLGVEIDASDLQLLIPELDEFFVKLFENRRGMRGELYNRLLIVVAEYEKNGVSHSEAVHAAIKRFGDAAELGRNLGRILRRDFSAGTNERAGALRPSLDRYPYTQTAVAIGLVMGFNWVFPRTDAGIRGFAILLFLVGIYRGYIDESKQRIADADSTGFDDMQRRFSEIKLRPQSSGSSMIQVLNRTLFQFAVAPRSNVHDRHKSAYNIAILVAVNIGILTYLWINPVAGILKKIAIYLAILLASGWLGHLVARRKADNLSTGV